MSKILIRNIKDTEDITIINKIVIEIITAFSFLLILGYVLEAVKSNRTPGYVAMLSAITLISLAADYVFYLRDKGSAKNRYVFLAAFLVTYAIALFTSATHLGFIYFIPLLIALILYGDMRLIYLSCTAFALLGFGEMLYKALVLNLTEQADIISYTIEAAGILIASYCFIKAASAIKYFFDKSRDGLLKKQSIQTTMLKDIVEKTAAVNPEPGEMPAVIDTAAQAGKIVKATAVTEFAQGTAENAEHSKEQPALNSLNLDSSHDTGEPAVVQIAETLGKAPTDGITAINNPEEQPSLVELINKEVISALNSLQDKTKEALNTVSAISNTSGQTGMPALNVSGEQVNRISPDGSDLEGVTEMMTYLTEILKEVDKMVADLYSPSSPVADNISLLSSVSEEIAATSQSSVDPYIKSVDNSAYVKDLVDNLLRSVNNFAVGK